jgi:hypothetical protein
MSLDVEGSELPILKVSPKQTQSNKNWKLYVKVWFDFIIKTDENIH